ncbi:MAG: hypothetical protein ACTSXO_05765 [Candidatus Heimdallarchaeota archaeon]|nr:MAG: hypothetical protein DRP02_09790 [Candidatus Gerdarchaeota archaeon]RLI69888.1 MAG: hypothetical protein DRO91_07375 [Candidatus Heimdallarchaeota archaeon]
MSRKKGPRNLKGFLLIILLSLFVLLPKLPIILLGSLHLPSHALATEANENQFPFVGQYNVYEVTQTTDILVAASGTLSVNYLSMLNETAIYGRFRIEITSVIEFYNESAVGSENLNTRHLYIDSSNTYMIYLFMEYFFDWIPGEVTPTPIWIFPQDMQVNKTVKFWNYYGNCSKSQSILIMEKYYEVFVFRLQTPELNMTLMYGFARHNLSSWYGMLFYMSASFYEPNQGRMLHAYFKLVSTNAELLPLGELNKKNILSITLSFYSVVIVGSIIVRLKKRRDLIGGEV